MDFIIGCNYWASNAGTEMWQKWDENAVREDLRVLSENGVEYMRVFPNWHDFQPVIPVYGYKMQLIRYCLEGDKEPENPEYIDETMLARFRKFCDICEEFGVKLIVGILTGWMSGRAFIPHALFGKDLYTDPVALLFEQRFVRGIVTRMRDHKAIYAWDLGNECNCLGEPSSDDVALNWAITISNAIKACDNTRLVVSGMHSLAINKDNGKWTVPAQAEACDILTTHPYPYWSAFTDRDKIGSPRTAIHATCENKLYMDIGGKPCIVEEIGTMGPMLCDEARAQDFMRLNLLSNYVNGAAGVMWWCANEQTNLMSDPYTRQMVELELGMRRVDGTPKPVLTETGKISKIIKSLGCIPKAKEDAVCILTHDQSQWGVAYMTTGLAKSAGLNIRYAWCDDELPESNLYLMPSITGCYVMRRERYLELIRRVEEGATLYISNDNGILAEFEALTGLRVTDACLESENGSFTLGGEEFCFDRVRRYEAVSVGASVLATDNRGLPVISEYKKGKGRVIYVNFPLEAALINRSNTFSTNEHLIYRTLFRDVIESHLVRSDSKLGITTHTDEEGNVTCAAVNYTYEPITPSFKIADGYKIGDVLYGNVESVAAFDAVIFKLIKA